MFSRPRRAAEHVNDLDRAISRAVSAIPPSPFDTAMKTVSTAADHGLLWFAVAAVLSGRRGAFRKGAFRGLLAIAGSSFTANAVLKPLLPRRRPAAAELPAYQTIPNPPTSSSFPSGHSASAAAFATAVALESPRMGLAIAPLAAAVGYSRVHVGVHWASDVAVGAALGSGIALATQRWWPVRPSDEARARPIDSVPELPRGKGLVLVSNQRSGDENVDPAGEIEEALPDALVIRAEPDRDLDEQLDEAVTANPDTLAIGVAGGDGTVAAAAAVAGRRGLPLVVVPTGTLNHFARDVGVYDLQEAVDAGGAGQAVAVDLGLVDVHPSEGESDAVVRTRVFLNTASLGSYPDLVRLRERWQPRMGKWPAFAAALAVVLRRSEPVRVRVDGEWHTVWFLFIGNNPYFPRGFVPAWRPSLDSGLIDIRWLRADVRFSRTRAVFGLALGALGHSRVYVQREGPSFDVELEPARHARHRRRGRGAGRAATPSAWHRTRSRSTGATRTAGPAGTGPSCEPDPLLSFGARPRPGRGAGSGARRRRGRVTAPA